MCIYIHFSFRIDLYRGSFDPPPVSLKLSPLPPDNPSTREATGLWSCFGINLGSIISNRHIKHPAGQATQFDEFGVCGTPLLRRVVRRVRWLKTVILLMLCAGFWPEFLVFHGTCVWTGFWLRLQSRTVEGRSGSHLQKNRCTQL